MMANPTERIVLAPWRGMQNSSSIAERNRYGIMIRMRKAPIDPHNPSVARMLSTGPLLDMINGMGIVAI
jgi:hypothetical protein